jgi:hypothetical protein
MSKTLHFVKKRGTVSVRSKKGIGMANMAAAARVACCCAIGLAASPAVAQSVTFPLPPLLHYLATTGAGPINPEVIVGFNPQPDPPGFSDVVDLANRMDPSIGFSTGTPVTTTIVFGMHGPGSSDPYSASPGLFTSNSDGTRYVFDETGDGSVFQVTFDISGYTGGFNSFNPQPDPPGDVGFVFTGDPMMHFHIDLQLPGAGLAPLSFIPEPASLGLLMMGVGGLMGLRRKAVG